MGIQIELALLVAAVLFFISIVAGKASSRIGVPALLLFLSVGMLSGSDGVGIQFENIHIAQNIGTIALCIILFSGGLDTRIEDVKPIIPQGLILATFGVFLTALITGVVIWLILGWTLPSLEIGLLTSLLLASTMASTDSASVFSILRSKGLHLKNNLKPMLELESGSNDPMAFVIVITLIDVVKQSSSPNYWSTAGVLLLQLSIGAIAGYALGKMAVNIINRIKIGNESLYPILVFTFSIFIYSSTYFMKGNGFLAVYVAGLVIGNSKFVHKRTSLRFFDGLAWLFQLIMFLMLGLLVNPHQLIPVIIPALLISFAMIFIVRPMVVFTSLLPFRKMGVRDKSYISWVGLRGAVPIIFAIFPLVEEVPHADLIFNIVFVGTLVSLVVQGTSLPLIAKWLKLTEEPSELNKVHSFDVDFSTDIQSVTTEILVTPRMLVNGNRLMDISLPERTLVVLVKRGEGYFVPTGQSVLKLRDKILIITDNKEALLETYKNLKIE